MIMTLDYATKKELKASIGQPLKVIGSDVPENGTITGRNKPVLTGFNREFYANVTVVNGLIKEVK